MPFAVTLVLTFITLIAYTLLNEERTAMMYVQVMASALVTAILPIISMLTEKEFPLILNVLIMVHILLASNLGSAMGFYDRFACWDLIMHGYFGFVAAVVLYVLLLKWNGGAMNRAGCMLLIFLGVMGAAAVWEIFEYTCDALLGGDAQRVQEALALGISPVKDTMTDMIVAVVGVMVFYVGLYVDKRCKNRFTRTVIG